MLDALGLGPEEESVYRHLVERPSGDRGDLVRTTGLGRLEVDRALRNLEALGLVAHTGADHDRVVASPPGVALGALLVQRQEELRRAQTEMTALMGVYRGAGRRQDTDVVDVVQGPTAIAQRFAQLQHSARSTVQTLSKPIGAVVTREDNDETEQAGLARGVRYEAVVERAAFQAADFQGAVEAALDRGAQIRVTGTLPLRLLIVDREIAMVPVVAEGSDEPLTDALLVHPSGLLDGLMAVFDLVWQGATALGRGRSGPVEHRPDQLDETDTRVITMLLAGLTDQTIGAQLGMSLRTVQRRVRQLMDRAGVDTRLQLGFEAARRNWV